VLEIHHHDGLRSPGEVVLGEARFRERCNRTGD
jgi:hypothetical protein